VLFETFLEAGDELLLPVPTYTMYRGVCVGDGRARLRCKLRTIAVSFRAAAGRDYAANESDCDCQSQQPVGLRGHARADCWNCAARAASCAAGGRSVFSLPRRNVMDLVGTVPNLVVARTFSKAYGLAGIAAGIAGRAGGIDAMGAAGAFALQRELAGAGMLACSAWKIQSISTGTWAKCWRRGPSLRRRWMRRGCAAGRAGRILFWWRLARGMRSLCG
jgi:hypothetical protein